MRSRPSKDGVILPKSWCRECCSEDSREKYRADPEYGRWLQTQQMLRLKKTVLTLYGDGKCACVICGEDRIECLSIDHINGNGKRHRDSIGLGSGGNFYLWLRTQGYPDGYQTMCMNCQFVKKAKETDFRAGRDNLKYKSRTRRNAGVHMKCVRCGYEWDALASNETPKWCPECSGQWDRPRERKARTTPKEALCPG